MLFLCIAYVSLRRAKDTLVLVENETLKARYRRSYRILGFVMVLAPLTAFITTTLLTGSTARYVFFIETAGSTPLPPTGISRAVSSRARTRSCTLSAATSTPRIEELLSGYHSGASVTACRPT